MHDKIIFVDIDGCLTSVRDKSSYLCLNESTYGYSEEKMSMLKHIIDQTGCKVVISSNWRRFPDDAAITHGGHSLKNPLPRIKKELGEHCIGELTHERPLTKSEALDLWFEDNGLNSRTFSYVIFDDDPREGFLKHAVFIKHYIHCNPEEGLTNEQCERIIDYFVKKSCCV